MKKIKIKARIIIGFVSIAIWSVIMAVICGYAVMAAADGASSDTLSIAARSVGLITLIMLANAFLSAKMLVKGIANPVAELTKAANQLAIGDVEVTLSERGTEDEITELLDAFRTMADNIQDQATTAHELSQGNLQVEVSPRSDKDILGWALKEIVDDYNILLAAMKESTTQVTAGAGQVASASQALAHGSTQQASAIEQITASMDEIADKTRINASQASEADKLAREVAIGAEAGNDKMREMVAAMKEINQSSVEISKIIKTIDDIAFQTNILALNATVEAARAGVHGKGFAVVAEEVRNLAEKSAQAANETGDMINNSISKVNNGSELAKETAKSLEDIVKNVEKTAELINNIAMATNNQATAVTEINQSIGQVSQVVQNNSASSEECAASSEELANQAEALIQMLGKYQLKETGRSNVVSSSYTSNSVNQRSSVKKDNESIISLEGDFGKY